MSLGVEGPSMAPPTHPPDLTLLRLDPWVFLPMWLGAADPLTSSAARFQSSRTV